MRTRLLYVHHAIGMGGAPRSLAFLISNLDTDQFEPFLLMPKRPGNGDVKRMFEEAGATVVEEQHIRPFNGVHGCRCDSLGERGYALASAMPTMWAVSRHVRNLKPRLVHINTSVLPFAAAGVRLANPSIPTLVHVRETILETGWGRMLAWLNRRFATHFIGIDQNGLEKLNVADDRVTVVRNFVNREDFRPGRYDGTEFRRQFQCGPDDVLFLSLARIAHSNGSLEWAQFLAKHQSQLPPNAKFVICGFSERESEYVRQTLAAIDQNDNVFASDFTPKVGELIAAADVIVASFTEPHCARMVIEGAAMNLPSMVTDLENLVEQIEPDVSGFIFDLDRPEQILEQIRKLAGDGELRTRMGQAAGEFAARHYDDKVNSRRVIQLYERFLHRNVQEGEQVASTS